MANKMKCPNCRCVVPNSYAKCNYCGYSFHRDRSGTRYVTSNLAYDQFHRRNTVPMERKMTQPYVPEFKEYNSYSVNSVETGKSINNLNLILMGVSLGLLFVLLELLILLL